MVSLCKSRRHDSGHWTRTGSFLAGPLIFGRKIRAFTLVAGEITTSLDWTPVSVSTPAETKSMFQYLSMRPSLYTLKRPGKSWDISVLAGDIASFIVFFLNDF